MKYISFFTFALLVASPCLIEAIPNKNADLLELRCFLDRYMEVLLQNVSLFHTAKLSAAGLTPSIRFMLERCLQWQ